MGDTKTVARAGSTTKPKKKDIRKEIKARLNDERESWFDVAIMISEIYHSEIYKTWGFDRFEDYAESKSELEISYRSAMSRIQIGDAIKATGLTRKQLKKVGLTKFKELSGLLSTDTSAKELDKLLSETADLSLRDTQDYVKAKKLQKEVVGQTVSFLFKFINEQADLVNNVLDSVCELINTTNKNLALEYALTEWEMNHNPKLKDKIMKVVHIPEDDGEKVGRKTPAHKGKGKDSKK